MGTKHMNQCKLKSSKFKVQSSKLRNIEHRTLNIINVCIFLGFLLMAGCGRGDIAKSSQVLAKVDNKEITISYFERHMDNLPESLQRLSTEGKGKRALLEAMINREILYNEAIKRKIDKDAEIKRRVEDVKKELVINTLIQKELINKLKVDDKEVQDYYNAHPEEFKNREEIRISQIVVPERKDADDILEKLRGGSDFGELAGRYSTDKSSALRRGDVGYYTYKMLPPEIRDSVFKMKIGETSQAYKMPGGYEIYKITDRRVVSYSFEQAKGAIKLQLLNQKFQESLKSWLDDLKKDVKVQINESLLK